MKTISLELDERVYPKVVSFLRLLPEDYCHILEDGDTASDAEQSTIATIQQRLAAGDESEFEDWDEVKRML
jgi:hypothetical protein